MDNTPYAAVEYILKNRKAYAAAKAKRKQDELNQILLVTGVLIGVFIVVGYFAYEAITFCQVNRCGK